MDWNNPLIYIVPGLAVLSGIIYLSRWMGKTDESVRLIEEAIKEIKSDIKEILRQFSGSAVERKSPLRLTEGGQSISDALDAKAWAARTVQDLLPKLKGSHPYDIQMFCMDCVDHEGNLTHEFVQKMKSCAYEEAFPMSQIKDVLAIELRDAILKILPD